MSEFILGMLPILIIWAVPLAPMLCAAIAATIETLASPVRRGRPEAITVLETAT